MAEQSKADADLQKLRAAQMAPTKATQDHTRSDDLLTPVDADWSGLNAASDPTGSITAARIGRYELVRLIGQGGFGRVFLARDTELDRMVAVKLPHLDRIKDDHRKQMYLQEAKTLARLDHPSIVPIYDYGVVDDGRCFVVSKYIQGDDLSKLMSVRTLQLTESVRLLIAVAEALHFVHRSGFVHRDIKPANLLLGDDGRIYVADFGLAIRDEATVEQLGIAGTPSYMSPEQIRREGHRIDGRSDQFSLGVVMYEMLTGERPFAAATSREVMELVLKHEPRPPRQVDARVPAQLNRICLKLLSKLASQRYAETIELAHDLRDWLNHPDGSSFELGSLNEQLQTTGLISGSKSRSGQVQLPVIVPRGLRAFTRSDAYFFLDLLPGPRDRIGLPESISRWKQWTTVDEDDPAFHRIGVVSGPTGCGKSSLVRAGLLPVLNADINTVLIEASADLTEKQLSAAIQRRMGDTLGNDATSLAENFATVRRNGISQGEKLLIVIDQFEQWLNANVDVNNSELVLALRQCDGLRLQCILIVRDDFWLALSRFFAAIEVPLQVGRNAMMVDLFDLRHARKVLIEFGRGYRCLPIDTELSRDQEKFIDGAIDHLTTDGGVIPVHLALFGEMVKNRDWTTATLKQLGGAAGVGVQFLNESFSATYAPANQRFHELAARNVLRALLPTLGTEIKASRRTRAELFELSGYDDRASFDSLMGILNSDLKLVSAIDAYESSRTDSASGLQEDAAFQLSHDFLVPSIREWLSAKQRESFRGRLHQRLSEQASLWSHQKRRRFLPNMLEGILARMVLPTKALSEVEKSMLRARDRQTGAVVTAVAICIAGLYFATQRLQATSRISALVEQLTTAEATVLPKIVDELKTYGSRAADSISLASLATVDSPQQRFVPQIAKLHFDHTNLDEAFEGSLQFMTPELVPFVTEALLPHAKDLKERYWQVVVQGSSTASTSNSVPSDAERVFRAAQILCVLDPPESASEKWQKHASLFADLLESACSRHPDEYARLSNSMRPAISVLLDPLRNDFLSRKDDGKTRYATSLLASYTTPDSPTRTRLAIAAVGWQRDLLFPKPGEWHQAELWEAIRSPIDESTSVEMQNRAARQKATAAALLIAKLNVDNSSELLDLLRSSPNPTVRSHLIGQCKELRVPATRLLQFLRNEVDTGIQSGLMLALGEYSASEVPVTKESVDAITKLHRETSDPGVQATAEWLLRRWLDAGQYGEAIRSLTADRNGIDSRRIQTPIGMTLVKIDALQVPGIDRTYWIADCEISIKMFREFRSNEYFSKEFGPSDKCPANVIEWRDAVSFCNWLSEREGLAPFYPGTDEAAEQWTPTVSDYAGPGYRLPTVAEWEYACRGGTTTPWYCGTDIDLLRLYANYLIQIDQVNQSAVQLDEEQSYKSVSLPCGTLRPNDFGLFDMHGNVEEWCQDAGEFNSSERRVRGGSASFYGFTLKVDREGSLPPRIQNNSLGFRVVRTNSP